MKRKTFTPEQIVWKLREAEVLLSQGQIVGSVSRKLEVAEQIYYRWSRECGGMRLDPFSATFAAPLNARRYVVIHFAELDAHN